VGLVIRQAYYSEHDESNTGTSIALIGQKQQTTAGNKQQTLVNALLNLYSKNSLSNIRGNQRYGIVHRLDKDTSGLLIVAKHNHAHNLLSEMIKERKIERYYIAICCGIPVPTQGRIETSIIRDRRNIERMIVANDNPEAKKAITNYKLLEKHFGSISIVECKLDTGRTHQIRLHMLHIGNPIVGDKIYCSVKNSQILSRLQNFTTSSKVEQNQLKKIINLLQEQSGQMLCAYKIRFTEPITKENIEIDLTK
jgi:RluA family pseudouridine synthase